MQTTLEEAEIMGMGNKTLLITLFFLFCISLMTIASGQEEYSSEDVTEEIGRSPENPIVEYIDPTPKMPSIIYEYASNPENTTHWEEECTLNYSWIDRKYDKKAKKSITFINNKSFVFYIDQIGAGSRELDFQDVIMGGDLKIVTDQDGIWAEIDEYYKILGKNPNKKIVKAELGDLKYQIIGYKESKWKQFNDTTGYPTFGPPAGYGVMQLDPVPSYKELWDWKANVKAGKANFNNCMKRSKGLSNYVNKSYKGKENVTQLTDDQILRQAYYFYNAGSSYKYESGNWRTYYVWDAKKDSWIVNNNAVGRSKRYANDAMNIYNNISEGKNLPRGW